MAGLLNRQPLFEETASLFTNEKVANTRAKIIDWLNEAGLAEKATKCELLAKIQELLINSDDELLDEFLDNVLTFTQDPAPDVKRAVIGFIEAICQNHIKFFPRVVPMMSLMLRDSSAAVQKRVIQACGIIYKNALKWICSLEDISESVESAWSLFCNMKAQIVDMIDHDNDGIRTNAIKCLESVIIVQTHPDEDSMKREGDFSLEDVPMNIKIVKRRKLEDEALNIFDCLIKFHAASHISSVNLIACTGTLCTIAKLRPSLMQPVIEAINRLNSNLPPTLTDSQISSVRKHLKMQLLNILRQPASYEHQGTIIQILSDVGASNQEIGKAIPKLSKQEQQKRAKRALENAAHSSAAKKLKIDDSSKPTAAKPTEMEVDVDELNDQLAKSTKINSDFLVEHLKKPENVVSLVVKFMPGLPTTIPQSFVSNYKPFLNISREEQIARIGNLLGEQMTEKRCGPGASSISKEPPMRQKITTEEEKSIVHGLREEPMVEDEEMGKEEKRKEEALKKLREQLERVKGEQQVIPKLKQRVKTLKLQEITKPLSKQVKEKFLVDAVKRILEAERVCSSFGVSTMYRKILIALGSCPTTNIRDMILEFIFQNPKSRMDFAFSWLYEEYSMLQGFTRHSYLKSEAKKNDNYNRLFLDLVNNIIKFSEEKDRMKMIRTIYLGAPLLTDGSIKLLVEISEMTELNGMDLIRELIILRPPKRDNLMDVLLKFSVHSNSTVREMAIENLVKIREEDILVEKTETFALKWLVYLEKEKPEEEMFSQEYGRAETSEVWTEDLAKVCLGLYFGVLSFNDTLVHSLCKVYTSTINDMKRTILRGIEYPIRKIGSNSVELLNLIESCPKGAETLITRMVYILTEKSPPTMDLVNRVRELYQNKVPEVRFLVPVLCCLTKTEILTALPRFLKLNEAVVKDVFKRLLGIGQEYVVSPMPITPAELLVALHKIDPAKVELKFIMQATRLCLTEKETYTHEVMAVVLQQLVEITPLPTLLMRTVIQSLSLYPRLGGFVTNLLHRLIMKQVWKQKVVWEGFIKCSQRLIPHSIPVLLQLPPLQLQDALVVCPELRDVLLQHCQVEVGVSKQIMDILLGRITLDDKKDEDEDKVLIRPDPSQPLPPGEDS